MKHLAIKSVITQRILRSPIARQTILLLFMWTIWRPTKWRVHPINKMCLLLFISSFHQHIQLVSYQMNQQSYIEWNKLLIVFIAERIVCYYGTWSTYRHGNGAFNVEDIDANLCTHLIYTFFGVTSSGTVRIIDPYLDLEENWGRGNIKKFNNLKLINPKLKTLAAVGGWNEGSRIFSQVKYFNHSMWTNKVRICNDTLFLVHYVRWLAVWSFVRILPEMRSDSASYMVLMAWMLIGSIRTSETEMPTWTSWILNCCYRN